MKPQLKNLNMGEALKKNNYDEFEEACKIEPIRSYKLQYVLIMLILLSTLFLSSCTSLELGVHYSKMAYNKCHTLGNWQCLWYDE